MRIQQNMDVQKNIIIFKFFNKKMLTTPPILKYIILVGCRQRQASKKWRGSSAG